MHAYETPIRTFHSTFAQYVTALIGVKATSNLSKHLEIECNLNQVVVISRFLYARQRPGGRQDICEGDDMRQRLYGKVALKHPVQYVQVEEHDFNGYHKTLNR